eukprot:125071-Prymnesium_polylepis.2
MMRRKKGVAVSPPAVCVYSLPTRAPSQQGGPREGAACGLHKGDLVQPLGQVSCDRLPAVAAGQPD